MLLLVQNKAELGDRLDGNAVQCKPPECLRISVNLLHALFFFDRIYSCSLQSGHAQSGVVISDDVVS